MFAIIVKPGQVADVADVALERLHALARRGAPQPHRPIAGGRGDERAVGREGRRVDEVAVALERRQCLAPIWVYPWL